MRFLPSGSKPPASVSGVARSSRPELLFICSVGFNLAPAFEGRRALAASTLAAAQLGAAGFDVELAIEPYVGNTISSAGAQAALTFLKKSLM